MVQNKKSAGASYLIVCKFFLFMFDFYQLLFSNNSCCCISLTFVDPKLLQLVRDKENSGVDLVIYKLISFISDFYLVAIAIAITIVMLCLAFYSLSKFYSTIIKI